MWLTPFFSEKQGAGYAGKKFKPHKNDLNRFVKHERTLTDNSGVINESVDIIEKDGRVKVMTPLPRDVSGSIDIEPTNVALTKANPIVSDLRNDNRLVIKSFILWMQCTVAIVVYLS